MEQDFLNSVMQVRDPDAAAIFVDSRARRLLMQFVPGPRSVGDVARALQLDLKQTHYRVCRLVDVGLLTQVDRLPRAGRPIRRYRAAAASFIVSDLLLPRSSTAGLATELRDRLEQQGGGGMILRLGPGGEPQVELLSDPSTGNASFELWRLLRLSPAEVREIRAEMEAILARYQSRERPRGQVHLVHCALARRADGSGPDDHPRAPSIAAGSPGD